MLMSFFCFCNQLRPHLERQVTLTRQPVDVEKQVVANLYYLSDEGCLRKIANVIGPKYIRLPQTETEVKEKIKNFEKTLPFPQCLGAVNDMHINIKQPSCNATDYVNQKSWYSINVQVCCDYRRLFMDICSSEVAW